MPRLQWGLAWPIEIDLYHMGRDQDFYTFCGIPWSDMRWTGYVHYPGSHVCPVCAERYAVLVLEEGLFID